MDWIADRQFFDRYFLALRQELDGPAAQGPKTRVRGRVDPGDKAGFLLPDPKTDMVIHRCVFTARLGGLNTFVRSPLSRRSADAG